MTSLPIHELVENTINYFLEMAAACDTMSPKITNKVTSMEVMPSLCERLVVQDRCFDVTMIFNPATRCWEITVAEINSDSNTVMGNEIVVCTPEDTVDAVASYWSVVKKMKKGEIPESLVKG